MGNDMEDLLEHWIWLQQALGAGSPKAARLAEAFGGAAGVYSAARGDYFRTGLLSDRETERLCDKSLQKSEETVSRCMEKGYSILTLPQLPERLRSIYAPPCALYVWGTLPEPSDGVYIAMVGTRAVTPYGVEAATKLSEGLARCGATVVSGLAIGVDGASHKGALKGGGKTVAVVGCGLDIDYPAQHTELRRLIAQNGAVVSEYPPGARPDRANFPVRNRIIAGLSLGCVVVEAGSRSGALITAALAAEMGRDVFAVPGSIFSPVSEGANRLLRDGAKPACGVLDILEEYIGLCPQSIISGVKDYNEAASQLSFDTLLKLDPKDEVGVSRKTARKPTPKIRILQKSEGKMAENPDGMAKNAVSNVEKHPSAEEQKPTSTAPSEKRPAAAVGAAGGLSESQAKVYNALGDRPIHVDEIALKANLELRVVLAVLTTLEIEGYVQSFPGRRYTAMK